jgi:putative transposase
VCGVVLTVEPPGLGSPSARLAPSHSGLTWLFRTAVAARRNAVALRDLDHTTLHSDRGSQFRSRKLVELLPHEGITGSMGRVGACGDNAAMESFFALLQKNVRNKQRWRSRDELRLAILTWIERTYRRRRRQRGLGRLTPIEVETIKPAAQAA